MLKLDVTRKTSEKSLTKYWKRSRGRNNQGRITSRHRGGGKKLFRFVDLLQREEKKSEVLTIESDPFRSSLIALVKDEDGGKRYILAPLGLSVGDKIIAAEGKVEIRPGNRMPLRYMPLGIEIHNLEMNLGKGGQLVRSAGTKASILAKEGEWANIQLPSGEVRRVHLNAKASVGALTNADRKNVSLGNAGRKRHMGWRPKNRGVAMNPNDHPHGGGEGRSPIGMPGPKTPWGKPTLGYKTRKRKDVAGMILTRRKG